MGRQSEATGKTRGPRMSYASCRVWSAVPEGLRRPVSRQMACHLRRIGHLPRELGERLDERAAPFYVLRWVAWGDDAVGQLERFHKAMKTWEAGGRWPSGRLLEDGGLGIQSTSAQVGL